MAEEQTMAEYGQEQLGAVGYHANMDDATKTKRKRTSKPRCTKDDMQKMLAHEDEWSNKTPAWIATKLGRSEASVRTTLSTLRQEGFYPKTLEELARSVARQHRNGNGNGGNHHHSA